jgi:hypothetical protein
MRRMCEGGVARIAVIGLAGRCQYSQCMAKAGCLSALMREIQRETKMPVAMQTAKDSLAAGHVADEEHEQDRRGDIDVPEADLPLVIETPRDVGVGLHAASWVSMPLQMTAPMIAPAITRPTAAKMARPT